MKGYINTNLIKTYLSENNLSKTKFCKLSKITLHSFNNVISERYSNTNIKVFFRIARQMNLPIYKIFE